MSTALILSLAATATIALILTSLLVTPRRHRKPSLLGKPVTLIMDKDGVREVV